MSNIILYIAISSDGFIADINGNVDWLPQPQNDNDLEIFGYKNLMERVDIILMGSKSYQQIMNFGDWAWKDKHTYVFSSQDLESNLECITIANYNPADFVQQKLQFKKDIWLLGGAELAKSFARENLIDEVIITIIPLKIENGIKLDINLESFILIEEKSLTNGITQNIYLKNNKIKSLNKIIFSI